MKLKLFHKIALFSILLATLPAAIVGWQTATLNREHLENNILELHTNLANSLARRIDFYLDGVTGKLRALIESLRIQGISSPASIQAFLDSNHEFVSFSFVNASGREIMKTVNEIYGEGQSFVSHADDPLFKTYAAQEAGGVIDPKFMLYFEKGEPRLKIFYPYDPSSIKRGSLMIVISLRELWDDILSEGAGVGGGGRHIFIADQFGNLIAHSDPSTMKKILESGPIPAPDHPLVREALQARTIGSKEFKDSMGQDMVGSYALVKWTGWVSAIQQQKKGAFAPIYQTRTRAWIVIILSILLAGVSAIYLSKGLSRPIFEIIEAARKVAENNFDQQVKISSDDELGNLAETFNEMVWALRSYHDLQVDRIIEEKTKTESVIFSIADGLIMTDHTGKIQIMNQRAAHVFDLDGDRSKQANPWNWVGKNILDVIKDDSVHEVLKKALMESGSQTKEITMTHGEDVRHYQMSSESVVNPKTSQSWSGHGRARCDAGTGARQNEGDLPAFHNARFEKPDDINPGIRQNPHRAEIRTLERCPEIHARNDGAGQHAVPFHDQRHFGHRQGGSREDGN